ncbi:MAG: hypothetical protein LBV71_05265 [Prevotella sp.]|jgi:hypothetical protein|nr:hypothetical protein [Prevotella sp.]
MANEKKRKQYPKATIQLDKLVLCCTSMIEDNFNDAIKYYPEESIKPSHTFGETTLIQTIDKSRRYRYSYNVNYGDHQMGRIDFCMFGQSHRDEIWFSISNMVFYNGTSQFLPQIFTDLNLKLNNITRLEIALDSYHFNHEQVLRRNIRNKENAIKLMNKFIDREARTSRIKYWNYGSPNNPYNVRTIYIQNERLINYPKKGQRNIEQNNSGKTSARKSTIELAAYNKLEEIKDFSPHKTYILDYHKKHNPKFKNIHRQEIRLESEELKRYEKKHKKPITLLDLLNKEFLYNMFTEYYDRIIVIKNSKKEKIQLYPVPCLDSCEGKLPLPLPDTLLYTQQSDNKINANINFNKIKDSIINEYKEIKYRHEIFINKISNNIHL